MKKSRSSGSKIATIQCWLLLRSTLLIFSFVSSQFRSLLRIAACVHGKFKNKKQSQNAIKNMACNLMLPTNEQTKKKCVADDHADMSMFCNKYYHCNECPYWQ